MYHLQKTKTITTYMISAAIAAALALVIGLVDISANVEAQTQVQQPTVNFTQLFKEKLPYNPPLPSGLNPNFSVAYESPTTVVLQGESLTLIQEYNKQLWQAVDIVKQHGFTIDSVMTSGLSTSANPLVYHIVLSHK